MGMTGIGWWIALAVGAVGTAVTYLWPAAREFGFVLLFVGMVSFIIAIFGAVRASRAKIGAARTMLVIGIIGTWVFLTMALGLSAWMVLQPQASVARASAQTADEGPLQWYYNLTMHGGPLSGSSVASLMFSGANVSQKEVLLKSAVIRSAIDGSEIVIKVDAQNEWVAVDQINLIPPGAPVKLIAVFSKQGGITKEEFLASWARFNLVVKDDTKEYRVPFNEGSIAPFFPGMVGPRVTKKS